MKKVRTFRIDTEVSDKLDKITVSPYTYSWHLEQALNGYGPIKKLAKPQGTSKRNVTYAKDAFEEVWVIYGKKGNRKSSLSRFSNLSNLEREAILAHVPGYVLSTPDKQYRKDFQSYINQECWNDEVTPNGPNQPRRPTATGRGTPAQRTEAAGKRWEAKQEGNVPIMGSDAGDLRPSVEQSVRGGTDGFMGETLDGDYTRTD